MSLRRIRRGELLVLLGLIGLIASLFLSWFDVRPAADGVLQDSILFTSPDGGSGDPLLGVLDDVSAGWGVLGHPWLEFLAITGIAWVAVLVLAVRAGRGRSTYGALVSLVLAIPLTALVLLLTLIRTVLATPSASLEDVDAVGFGNIDRLRDVTFDLTPSVGTWIGLASLLIGLVGLWVAMADDRTSAAESAEEPPPASPIPEPRPVASEQAPPAA